MSSKISLVYNNIHIYRIIMNLLYGLKYKKRFDNIIKLLNENDKRILELCFGDIYIAEYAKKSDKEWKGYDINEKFIEYASKKGFNAINKNIFEIDKLDNNDVVIIVGSLYHFNERIDILLEKMLNSTKKVIISEPIKNLSNSKYMGFIAKKSANAGHGEESFRFTKESFLQTLDKFKNKLSFEYEVISEDRDILVVLTRR